MMRQLVRLREMYLHLRAKGEAQGGHPALTPSWDNHKVGWSHRTVQQRPLPRLRWPPTTLPSVAGVHISHRRYILGTGDSYQLASDGASGGLFSFAEDCAKHILSTAHAYHENTLNAC